MQLLVTRSETDILVGYFAAINKNGSDYSEALQHDTGPEGCWGGLTSEALQHGTGPEGCWGGLTSEALQRGTGPEGCWGGLTGETL